MTLDMTKLPSMIVRSAQLRSIPSFLLPFTQSTTSTQLRKTHGAAAPRLASPPTTFARIYAIVKTRPVPSPTPFVPDLQTFFTLIGRNLAQYAPKMPSWKDFFALDTRELKKLGIESPRARRYLARWRERYRTGQHGPGGDLRHVTNGVALLRIVEVPRSGATAGTATLSPGMRKIVVNVAAEGSAQDMTAEQLTKLQPVSGLTIKGGHTIAGPWVRQMKGNAAKIEVTEGMWQIRRGHKIDGGERRQAEVRAKRRGEEKRAATGGAR